MTQTKGGNSINPYEIQAVLAMRVLNYCQYTRTAYIVVKAGQLYKGSLMVISGLTEKFNLKTKEVRHPEKGNPRVDLLLATTCQYSKAGHAQMEV
jgi:hypothetical protein